MVRATSAEEALEFVNNDGWHLIIDYVTELSTEGPEGILTYWVD